MTIGLSRYAGGGMNLGLPEEQRAMQLEQAAKGGYQQGIGLTEPPATPTAEAGSIAQTSSPAAVGEDQVPPASAAGPAAGGGAEGITADEPLIDFKKDPFGAIGLLLSNVAAGMEGKELPTVTLADARQKHVLAKKKAAADEIAARFQQANLGMQLFDAAYKVGLQNPENIDDLVGRFGNLPGLEGIGVAAKNAIASKLDRMDQRMAVIRSTQSPRLAEIAASLLESNDIEGFDKFTGSLLEAEQKVNEATRTTGATTAARVLAEGETAPVAAQTAATIESAKTGATADATSAAGVRNLPANAKVTGTLAAAAREPIGEAAARAGAVSDAQAASAGRAPITPIQDAQLKADERGQTETERHNHALELAATTKANMESSDANVKRQGVAASYDTTLRTLDKLVGVKDPKTGVRKPARGFREAVGAVGPFATGNILDWNLLWPTSGSDRATFVATLNSFKAQTFVPMVQQLVGMGALSNAEGDKLTDAAGALKLEMGEKAFLESADEIRKNLEAARARIPGVAPAGGFVIEAFP